MQKNRVISIFGDSILKGVRMLAGTTRYGTTDDIGLESIAKSHDWILDNRSRFGCTAETTRTFAGRRSPRVRTTNMSRTRRCRSLPKRSAA